jgi:hypothetical protein
MISSFWRTHVLKQLAFSFLLAARLLCASPISTTVKLVDAGHPLLDDATTMSALTIC